MKTFLNFIGQVAIAIAFVVVAAFGTSAWYTHPVEMTVCVLLSSLALLLSLRWPTLKRTATASTVSLCRQSLVMRSSCDNIRICPRLYGRSSA